MKTRFTILCFSAFVVMCFSAPTTHQEDTEIDPELAGGYEEGDMIFDNQNRNGLVDPTRRWPFNIAYYRFADDHFDEDHRNQIKLGMQQIEAVTCIKFIEADEFAPYFFTITGFNDGCNSHVGFLNNQVQRLNLQIAPLNKNCFRLGTIVHELLHTLGFRHMHNSYDRDDYVEVFPENIIPAQLNAFTKYTSAQLSHYGEAYDYGSVLHYGPLAFSANGLETIVPTRPEGLPSMRSSMGHEMQKYHQSLLTTNTLDAKAKSNGKYGLRERQKRRHGGTTNSANATSEPPHKQQNSKAATPLSSVSPPSKSTNSSASKSKAPPLSKYRRKTANARERTRMREINTAFETLRHCVPQAITGADDAGSTNEKLTKITTLRLAMQYISLLTELLKNPLYKPDFPLECLGQVPPSFIKQKTKVETPAEEKETKKPTGQKSHNAKGNQTRAMRKVPKRLSKKRSKPPQQQQQKEHLTNSLESSSSSASNSSCLLEPMSKSLAAASHSLSTLFSSNGLFQCTPEFSSLILESDGESLHLSEHCLSPKQLFNSSNASASDELTSVLEGSSEMTSLESPLELNLQLMETSPSSLEFSLEQPPTTCISPLIALDSFSPFGDFLNDYPEQTSLDMFLT